MKKQIDENETVASEESLPKYSYGSSAAGYFDSGNSATVRNQLMKKINDLTKDFGMAGDVSTPTYGGTGSVKNKKSILNNISKILFMKEENGEEIKEEAQAVVPKTELQDKILGKVEHFERELEKMLHKEQVVQEFISGYEKLALLSKSYPNTQLADLFNLAQEVNDFKEFNVQYPESLERVDQVIYIDKMAHNLHQFKNDDGAALYKQLDRLADISKMAGERDRNDRLLLLRSAANIKKIEALGHMEILQKSKIDKSMSFWKLMEKAIKIGVERLNNYDLVVLREWLFTKI
jgi:hypothetical protein